MCREWQVIAEGINVFTRIPILVEDYGMCARDADEAWRTFKVRFSKEIRWISISVTEVKKK